MIFRIELLGNLYILLDIWVYNNIESAIIYKSDLFYYILSKIDSSEYKV